VLVDPQTVVPFPHAAPGKYVLITVGDTGVGIPPEILGNVFEPFFTTKTVGRTTGLGLSTASAIMRNHNGFMTIFSETGEGTIVKIYLPVGDSSEGEEGVDRYLGGGERVIIAQQQASLRDIMRKILEVHGYEAIIAADGAETVAIYRRLLKEVSAVIIDLDMPYMDGSATIKVLQQTNPALPIIATGDGMKDINVDSILPKPFTTRTLLRALKKALNSRTPAAI
jgi:CheY-like chemotaxis protein